MQIPIVEYFKVDNFLYIPTVISISEWNVWGKAMTWREQFVTCRTILNVKTYLLKINITINSNINKTYTKVVPFKYTKIVLSQIW
jgi:hypothetical protein